jgi:FixJ family two-component response regulator
MPSMSAGGSGVPLDPTIYIVDDDEAVRDSLALMLESHGIAARTYDSGAAFIGDYNPGEADCLVLDLHMPDMGGLELLERLTCLGLDVPVVIISGRADTSDKARASAAGAKAILDKPFSREDLLAAIYIAIGTRRL